MRFLQNDSHSPGIEFVVIGLSEGGYSLGNLQLETDGHVTYVM